MAINFFGSRLSFSVTLNGVLPLLSPQSFETGRVLYNWLILDFNSYLSYCFEFVLDVSLGSGLIQ